MVFADIQPRDEWDTEGSEGRPNDRQMEEAHFHRLEQILGGKTKRDVEKTMYETTIGLEPTISNLMIDGEYTCKHYSKGSLQIDKEQQENRGSIQELQKNACSTNNQHPEYEGLELAMKQLIEVTQNALVDMKTEISRMQCDLDKALADINSMKKRDEILHNEWRDRTIEFEKEFMGLVDELRQSMALEFTLCRQEDLKRHDAPLASKFNCVSDGGNCEILRSYSRSSNDTFLHNQSHEKKNTNNESFSLRKENGKVGSKNVEYYPIKYEQRAALNEEMLRRVSSHRLERSVAAVRGWLQSPTPSEESSIIGCRDSVPCQFQQKVSNLSTPNLFTSFKEEEELNPLHQHAKSFPRPFVKNDKDSCAFYSLDIKEALTKS